MRSLIVVMLVVVACNDSGGGGSPGNYADELNTAQCNYFVSCGMFPDLAECKLHRPVPPDVSLVAAVDHGSTVFDAGAAAACIAAIESQSCDYTSMSAREVPQACADAIVGTGATGAMCASNSECSSERCLVPSCQMACCIGTCDAPVPPAKLGESCAGRPCEAGLGCGGNNTCVARMPAGSPCQSIEDCDYGLGCGGIGNTCLVLPKLGESCGVDLACGELGAGCIAGKCTKLGLPGAACNASSECAAYYRCDTTSHLCAINPTLGQACTGTCGDDSWCEQSGGPGTCAARKPVGASCMSLLECQSLYCDPAAHACSLPAVCI